MNPTLVATCLAVGFAVLCAVQAARGVGRARAEEKVLKGYFLLGLSGIMAKVAAADGRVTDDETAMAQGFFGKMNLTDAERATCIGNFVVARRDGLTARDHANRFIAYANPTACLFLYDLLWRIALADRTLDPAEDRLLADVAPCLGLGAADYERFKSGGRATYDRAQLVSAGVPQTFLGLARESTATRKRV